MRADWEDMDADSYNILDNEMTATGASHMAWVLFGVVSQVVNDLAETTGEDREALLKRYLR